jgi:hypothetical protein
MPFWQRVKRDRSIYYLAFAFVAFNILLPVIFRKLQ